MSDQLVAVARELLTQLLSAGPQKGARLKPLLVREFERRTRTTFQQAFWNFPKFSAFLAANADLLEVIPPGGPGDVTVQLRKGLLPSQPLSSATAVPPRPFLSKPLWHAFTNPDSKRRRFYHKLSGQLAHYVEGSQTHPNPRIAAAVAADPNYAEIVPITAEQQATWMREFLESVTLPEAKRSVVANLMGIPYSSAVNTAFMATLGDYAEGWRKFRAARVHEAARVWAERRGIPFEQPAGSGLRSISAPTGGVMDTAAAETPAFAGARERDARRWLHTLVDSLETSELTQVLLPATVLLRITSGRRE